MDSFIECETCKEDFNITDKKPKLLPKCGHTTCLKCIISNNN
jgi:hypothetical protein